MSWCFILNHTLYKHVACGGLNRNVPHMSMDLNAWSAGSGTIKGCGLVEGAVSLLEEMCH